MLYFLYFSRIGYDYIFGQKIVVFDSVDPVGRDSAELINAHGMVWFVEKRICLHGFPYGKLCRETTNFNFLANFKAQEIVPWIWEALHLQWRGVVFSTEK